MLNLGNFSAILASTFHGLIGIDGQIPWKYKEDIERFKNTTIMSTVIMGRKTYESIGKPLSFRENIIVSETLTDESYLCRDNDRIKIVKSLDEGLQIANNRKPIFVIGGSRLYNESFNHPLCKEVYITFVPDFPSSSYKINDGVYVDLKLLYDNYVIAENTHGGMCNFQIWKRQNVEEIKYLMLMERILEHGELREDRTGDGTKSIFGTQLEFNLSYTLPLFTTKRVFWKGIVRELLWFLRGSTDARELQRLGVKIWDGNSSVDFLRKRGLQYPGGVLGPVYGHQWRSFDGDYKIDDEGIPIISHDNSDNFDYVPEETDQIRNIIHMIENDPTSRRIILNSWNPRQLKEMALPPCHVLAQFYVSRGKYLDIQVYQRSADMGLGVPFNVASYSILTNMIACATNLIPGKMIYTFGDTHIYTSHISAIKEQLNRDPRDFPKLILKNKRKDIWNYTENDIEIVDYNPMSIIKMEMQI